MTQSPSKHTRLSGSILDLSHNNCQVTDGWVVSRTWITLDERMNNLPGGVDQNGTRFPGAYNSAQFNTYCLLLGFFI